MKESKKMELKINLPLGINEDDEVIMIDGFFKHQDDFKGVTGSSFRYLTKGYKMRKQTYKFRAECIHDVLEFMKKAKFEYDVKIERKGFFPDVVVEIATKESIDSIISIFKKIPDSHVILETIQPKKFYTGDRIREAA